MNIQSLIGGFRKYALLLMAIAVFCSCAKPKAFQYRDIRNIKLESLGMKQTRASMELVFFNPNTYGVKLKSVDCDVYLDSNYAGKIMLDTLMLIPPAAEFVLPTHLDVDLGSLLLNGLTMLLGRDILVTAKGKSRVGKGGFYVTIPFTYEARQKLKFF